MVVALTATTSDNSTTIDYHFSGTVSSRTVTADMYLTQRLYNYKIAIVGTISGSATTMQLTITMPSSAVLSGSLLCVGHLCFDFTDSRGSCTYSSPTLTCTLGNSFALDPVALDTYNGCSIAGAVVVVCDVDGPAVPGGRGGGRNGQAFHKP